jgi:hypothetical protein
MRENDPVRRMSGCGASSDPLLKTFGHSAGLVVAAEVVIWGAALFKAVISGYHCFFDPHAWKR